VPAGIQPVRGDARAEISVLRRPAIARGRRGFLGWASDQNIAAAILTGGATFGGLVALFLLVLRHLRR
jgi:hypothetical protein